MDVAVGDGTAHVGLQAVAGTATPLPVVPVGTGNDLALAVSVPREPVAAARAAARPRTISSTAQPGCDREPSLSTGPGRAGAG